MASEVELFEAIGSFGYWQKILFVIFFYSNIVGIWQNYAMTFLSPNVPFSCMIETDNATVLPGECQVEVQHSLNKTEVEPCTKWMYNSSDNNLVNEWDLVCDREWLISFSKSVYMIGFMASVFVFGQVSDWIGRYPTMVITYVITVIGLILTLFSRSISSFLIFRFLLAFGRTGFATTGYVLIMETVGPLHRTTIGLAVQLGWAVGLSVLALIGYLFRDWFWFQIAISLPVLPIAFAFMFIPESPRWLMMRKKSRHLKKLILSVSAMNNIELKEDVNQLLNRLLESNKYERKGTLIDLFRTPRMRGKTFNMMYLWLVNAFMYYALSFNTNDLSGDPYVNFMLTGFLEFPSYAMLFYSVKKVGRRMTVIVLMIVSGAACLAILLVPNNLAWISTALSLFGKFCVTASFGLLYLYTSELFPTVVRSAALGSCSTVARIGSIIAPFSREMGKGTHPSVPNVIIAILAVSSGLFSLWLPETAGRKLPDSLEEGEDEEILELNSQCQNSQPSSH